jgi:hypothetical protein
MAMKAGREGRSRTRDILYLCSLSRALSLSLPRSPQTLTGSRATRSLGRFRKVDQVATL